MYHYIKDSNWKGIVPLNPNDFKQQIEWLAKNYEIVSPEGLDKPRGTKPYCVLTFDDATKDQYEVAFKFLYEKGIPGYFSVMSGPLENNRIPIFHLVHTVLSYFSDEEIWMELSETFDITSVSKNSNNYYFYEENLYRRYNKYTLNFVLDEYQSRSFLEKKLLSKFRSFKEFIDFYYINENEFKEIHRSGMTIGVHAKDHSPYNNNGIDFFKKEIEPCIEYMSEKLDIIPTWYTPAFGGGEKAENMYKELEDILRENDIIGAFTTKPGYNHGLNKFWLNRFDCATLLKNGNRL